jgi:mRNA interferase MazF
VKRFDVYWCRFDPTEGSEMGKTRPCVIVSLDSLNRALPTVVVCPLTSVPRPQWRTRLQITCNGMDADICAEQIRAISKKRLGRKIGTLSTIKKEALQELLGEMYGAEAR